MADDERLLGKLEAYIDELQRAQVALNKRLDQHETRLVCMEQWQWRIGGAMAVIAAGVSMVATLVVNWVAKHVGAR